MNRRDRCSGGRAVCQPGTDGIEATRQIVASGLSAHVLVPTTFDLDEYAFAALREAASGFLLKDAKPSELAGRSYGGPRGCGGLTPG